MADRSTLRARSVVTRLADVVMPWAAAHASAWPSQHSVHGGLLEEIVELEAPECVHPGCPWENTDSCRFMGEHPHKMRRWALVGDVEDG